MVALGQYEKREMFIIQNLKAVISRLKPETDLQMPRASWLQANPEQEHGLDMGKERTSFAEIVALKKVMLMFISTASY